MSSSDDSDGAELRIICGPTAAGKTSVALRLAARHGLEIVSADSRQIYRGFDIGTAKPTAADRRHVVHHALDVADPGERWSAARWASDAARVIAATGRARVLVVGGTGFYLRALVAPLFAAPTLDAARRAAMQAELGTRQTEELRRWVRTLDPPRAHLGRAQLLRAAEFALLTGQRMSDLHRAGTTPRPLRVRWLVVDPLAALPRQIAQRLDAMLAAGWADEVRELSRSVPPDAPAWQACGYHTMRLLTGGVLAAAAARDAILIATRQYAKRQRTWFRHQLGHSGGPVTVVNPHDPQSDALVEQWWRSGDPA